MLSGAAVAVLAFYFGLYWAAAIFGILTVFTVFFFRDPERTADARADAVLSPADGRVISVREIDGDRNPLGAPAVKTSIFMSVFNVHVNRIPVPGTVRNIDYRPGKFLAAHREKASEANESNRILIETQDYRRIVLIQSAGLIARRIVCWVREQDDVLGGQRFGLIRFGSRVDLYLPLGSRLVIEPRQRVKAGETVIGYLS